MTFHPSRSNLHRFIRLVMAVAGAFALITLILAALLPARVARGEPQAVDLQLDKIGPNTALAGSTITYTILVSNASGQTLGGVVLTDTWNTQEYTGTYEVGGQISVTAFTLVTQTSPRYAQFGLADLLPNASGVITIRMTISPLLQPKYDRVPIFKIDGNSVIITTSNPGTTANNDSVDTTIVGPVLKLTKTVTPSGSLRARPGRLITYTFKLENLNYADTISATGVVISERLPNNTLFYTAYPPSLFTYYSATNTVQWNLTDPLPVSGTVYVTLTARVAPSVMGNTSINNPRTNCGARSDELPLFVLCPQDVSFNVDDVFEKETETVSPPPQAGSTISKTFPNRVVTYTVYVYNPFPDPVADLIVTDTLPTYLNNPTQTFQYSGLLSSSPPGLPAVISQSTRIVAWQLPTIEGWGVYTFAFQAFVPPQMRIDNDQIEKIYQNRLDGSGAGVVLPVNDGGHDDRMKVKVVPQITVIKTVTPTRQFYGLPVTYTLSLSNTGPTTISSIFITDVLPTVPGQNWCGFQWVTMLSGQAPITAAGNIAAWGPFTLTGYSQLTIGAFQATVFGRLNMTCNNTVEGYSPDTYIVRRTNLAPVIVDVPFRYNKTVNPLNVVLGSAIQYTVTQYNIGGIDATMDYFEDILPTGFYFNGSPVYTQVLSPPLVLQANHANEYVTTFPVVVSTTNECDNLPKAIPQKAGTFGIQVIAPPGLADFWSNSLDAASVTVRPQAQAFKTATPSEALPGDVVTYTITLSNNTASTLGSIRVTDTLANGVAFGGVLPGTDAPIAIVPPNVIWWNQTIPSTGTRLLVFTVTMPITTGNYFNNVKAASDADPLICIPKLNQSALVIVKRGLVEVNKTANPTSVGPLAVFQYNISLKNNGPYTVTVSRFTETLPGLAGYPWTFVSMQSGDPLPDVTNPHAPVWTNLAIGPNRTQNLRVNVRSEAQVGVYPNNFGAPSAGTGYMTASLPARWELTRPTNYNGAPVTVVPGVGLLKEVDPTTVFAGQDVVYTITLINISGQTINNVRVTDTLPSGFVFEQVIGGNGGVPISIDPLVWSLGSVANSQQKVMVFRVGIPLNQPSGTYYNQVAARADNLSIAPTGNIAPVVVSGLPTLDLSKSVDPATVIAGRIVTYTLTFINTEADDPVTGARLTDTLPSGFTYAGTISGPAPSITSPQVVWTNVDVPAGGGGSFVFRASVASSVADGAYYNQLDGSSPLVVFQGSGPTAPVGVLSPRFDVQVSKSDGAIARPAGGTTVYTIRYTNTLNTLSLTATNAVLTETFSPAAYLIADAPGWNLVSTSVYTHRLGDLPAGASGEVTFALQIDPGIPAQYLTITNTVQIAAGAPDSVPEAFEQPSSNNTSTDIDTLALQAELSVGKTDGQTSAVPGAPIGYTVVVTNDGPYSAIGASVIDAFPSSISGVTWTCGATPGSSCPAGGSGLISATVNLAVNGQTTFTVTGVILGSATGVLTNTASVTAPAGVIDSDAGDNSATDVDVLTPQAELSIGKTDGQASAVPGAPITYTVVVTNTGPGAVTGAVVNDTFPSALGGVTWVCGATPGSNCPPGGTGLISATVSLAAGGRATFTATGALASSATGVLTNTASVTLPPGVTDPNPGNNSATDVDVLTPQAELSISKTDGQSSAAPGVSITYTIVVTNTGPSAVTGAVVNDTFPSALGGVTWTCGATPGSSCPPGGTGLISATVSLAAGGRATFTATGALASSATGVLTNTASVALPPGVTDPNPSNNSATDIDTIQDSGQSSLYLPVIRK